MTDNTTPLAQMSPVERLRAHFRATQSGGCKILSLGDGCLCPFCDIDRITAALKMLRGVE